MVDNIHRKVLKNEIKGAIKKMRNNEAVYVHERVTQ